MKTGQSYILEIRKTDGKKNNAVILERNNLILELKKIYMELDDEMIKQKIMQKLEDMLLKVDTQLKPLTEKQYTSGGINELEFERGLQLLAQKQVINEIITFIIINK